MHDRWLTKDDYQILSDSLENDVYHQTTKPEFFYQMGTFCKVYEDELGPIMFVRGSKALRLDIQFVKNTDFIRNKKAMLEGFQPFVERVKAAGFNEIVFSTSSQLLKRFCIRELKFEEVEGNELRFIIN